jgi:hypothetical protein
MKLLLQILVAFTSVRVISANSCSICGEDAIMGNPQGTITRSKTLTCELLDRAGRRGNIPDHQCHLLAHFAMLCECTDLLAVNPDKLSRLLFVDKNDDAPATAPSNQVRPVFDLVEDDDSAVDWGEFVCAYLLFDFWRFIHFIFIERDHR